MSKALSVDLRDRVVAAVAAGSSRRAAAARFGVSVASAIRWCTFARQTGSVAPGALGGDRRSGRIQVHGALIRGLLDRKSDLTLAEIRAELAKAGVSAGLVTIWRFFQRHRLTRKEDRACRGVEPPGHPETALGLVRGTTRPRPRPPGLHR